MRKRPFGILVGVKGRGSNMEALIRAGREESHPGEAIVVVGPRADAPALLRAAELGVAVREVPYGDDFGARLDEAFAGTEAVCLAGFMRLVPPEFLRADRPVLNIHPALLPKFGGQGMYGHHVHEAVLAAGESESGCTVHRVTPRYDEGDILLQLRCPVEPDDTAEKLATRVLALEHRAYPEALARVLNERSSS